jgi:hypothetical protein
MTSSRLRVALAVCLAAVSLSIGAAGTARAGAPQPEQRQGDFAHVCRSGPNKNLACTVPTEDTDCPSSECVVKTLSGIVNGTLTLIAHDSVTDWANGGDTNRALTVLLEVKAPGGSLQLLSATYQNLADPTLAPTAPGNVVAIEMDEFALRNLTNASGLLFAQPESTLAEELRTLFGFSGTPVLVGTDKKLQSADHTTDGLGTVLRFKVKIQFLEQVD